MRATLLVCLSIAVAAAEPVPLAGTWRYAVESTLAADAADRSDKGVASHATGWSAAGFDAKEWTAAEVPGPREGRSVFVGADGAVWFRCVLDLPAAMAGKPAQLELGAIDDFDIAWVNGREVGRTGNEVKQWWKAPRSYAIPAGLLRAGANALAVRIYDGYGGGGFIGKPETRRLVVEGQPPVALPTVWRHRVEAIVDPSTVAAKPNVDAGIAPVAAGWSADAPEADAAAREWQACMIGGLDGYAPVEDGAFWYRREIAVADDAAGRDWVVTLGTVAGAATLWWDGVRLEPDAAASALWTVPAARVTPGTHQLALRIHDAQGPSGMLGSATEMMAGELDAVAAKRLRGPYLQMPSPEAVTVRWRSLLPYAGAVTVTPAGGGADIVVAEARPTREHEVRVASLVPTTDYRYRVHAAGRPADGTGWTMRTLPPTGPAAPLRIWVIGDSGTANANARAVYDAYRTVTGTKRTDLWLMLGDNAYGNGTDEEYDRAVFAMYPDMLATVPLFATLGNHDGHTADSATQSGPYYEGFTLPKAGECGGVPSGTEAYYSFDIGDIHVVCLDSYETPRAVDGAMHRWLEQDLAQAKQPWLLAFWHHPPYTKGSHDSDREKDLTEMRTNFLPLLESHGVDLVMTGHSHSYERSYAIDGHYGTSDTFDRAKHVRLPGEGDDRTGAPYTKGAGLTSHGGAVYLVAGSSGKISGGPLNHPAMVRSLNRLGSAVLERVEDRLDVTFLDEKGETLDRFTIVKKP